MFRRSCTNPLINPRQCIEWNMVTPQASFVVSLYGLHKKPPLGVLSIEDQLSSMLEECEYGCEPPCCRNNEERVL